jgi:hypothetical protein
LKTPEEIKRKAKVDREIRILIAALAGSVTQAWDPGLDDIAGLTPDDGNFIVGDGSNWITESGNTARTSLGLGTGDSPTFTGLTLSELTEGSVLFAGVGGRIYQDNDKLFFNDTEDWFGVGVGDPDTTLEIMSAGGGGNDFANDSNAVALWRFEGTVSEFNDDSVGSNDVTGLVERNMETTYFREGSQATSFTSASPGPDYWTLTEANMDADFPLKSGGAETNISVVFWVRPTALNSTADRWKTMISKWTAGNDRRSLLIYIHNNGGTHQFRVSIGHTNGTDTEGKTLTAITVATDKWYHVGFTYQSSDKAFRLRVYDEDADTVYETTGTYTNTMSITLAPFLIGAHCCPTSDYYFDGYIDEVAVFKDILSAQEIDDIRNNVFNVQAGGAQFKISYDGTNYVSFATESDGDLTIDSNKAGFTIDFGDALLTTTGTLNVGTITSSGNLIIADGGYIGSASDTDAMQIEADGDVVLTQGLTVTGSAVLDLNTAVFQPITDSTTFFQVNDKDGNVIANVDTVNNRVGFGIANPGNTIHLSKDSANHGIKISRTGSSPGDMFLQVENAGAGKFVTDAAFQIQTNLATSTKFHKWTNTGVGIFTANPQTYLHLQISTTTTKPLVEIEQTSVTGSAGDANIQFSIPGDAYAIGIDNTDDFFKIAYAAAEGTAVLGTNDYFVMDNSGNIGLGGETAPETLTEWTGTAPYITLHNSTHEDSDGGRESKLIFKGERSGGEENELAQVEVRHDGGADDDAGEIVISTSTAGPTGVLTERLKIDSTGIFTLTPDANTDLVTNYIGTTNSGVLTWMEDENYFDFADTVKTSAGRIINRTSVTSSPYTVLASDEHISVTTASTAITLNLPAIIDGTIYHIKDQDENSGGKNITVSPDGSDTVENAASLTINTNGASVTLVGNSTTSNWEIQ